MLAMTTSVGTPCCKAVVKLFNPDGSAARCRNSLKKLWTWSVSASHGAENVLDHGPRFVDIYDLDQDLESATVRVVILRVGWIPITDFSQSFFSQRNFQRLDNPSPALVWRERRINFYLEVKRHL